MVGYLRPPAQRVTHTGRNDCIERPATEAVGLFWRFMIEKFGVHPTPSGAPGDRDGDRSTSTQDTIDRARVGA